MKTRKNILSKTDKLFDLPFSKVTLIVLLILFAAVSWPSIQYVKQHQKTDKSEKAFNKEYAAKKIKWSQCVDGLCADLKVPKDYNDLSKGYISLALYKKVGSSTATKPTVLVNPGGPGGSGIQMVENSKYIFNDSFVDNVDLIGWDPRGVGSSTKTRCGDDLDYMFQNVDSSPDTQTEKENLLAKSKKFSDSCKKNSKNLIPYLTTVNSVKDMESIRIALGQEKLNFLGFSYGTFLGQVYSSYFPQNVGNFVLDGVQKVENSLEDVEQAKGFDDALNNFFDWCNQKVCDYIADTKKNFYTQDEQLRTTLDAKTAFLKLKETTEKKDWGIDSNAGLNELSPYFFEIAVASTLYGGESTWNSLDSALQAMAENDVSYMMNNANYYLGRSPKKNPKYDSSYESFLTITCSDSEQKFTVEQMEKITKDSSAVAPIFGPSMGYSNAYCLWWNGVSQKINFDKQKVKDVKLLFIGTRGDPATPYQWAVESKQNYPKSILLTYNGQGHTIFGNSNECVDAIVEKVFLQSVYPDSDQECS